MINPEIFRMYDIRGIVGKDLDDGAMERIGKAFGTHMRRVLGKEKLVLAIGSDHRESSPGFRAALVKGILSTGCDVIDVGVVPTPLLYYSIIKLNADGGAQITGSHNPAEYNGVKLCRGWPSIYGDEIKKVQEIVESGEFEEGNGGVREERLDEQYLNDLKSRLRIGKKLKVIVDAGNGMASEIAPKLLRALGCEVIELYCELDGTFPNHLPDPLKPELMRDLVEKVKETKADVGIAFDGDADRAGVVDENGNIVAADMLLLVYARDFLARNKGEKVVFEVKCSQALINGIRDFGGIPIMGKVGHSLIKARMAEEGAKLGGELSGHMYFKEKYYGIDDGFYAAARFLGIVAKSGKRVSELFEGVEHFEATPEIDVKCRDDAKFRVVEELGKYFGKRYETITVDGVRIVFPDGWGLVRASNTRPSLTLRMEAKTKDGLERIKKEILGKLAEFREVEIPENPQSGNLCKNL